MAEALAGRGRPVEPAPGASGWHVRTESIGATVQALSRIWGQVAAEARRAGLDEPTRMDVRGDPRFGAGIDGPREVRLRTRTSVLTLIVVAPRPELQERAVAAVAALATRHPSRAVVLAPGDPDGPSTFHADIRATCTLQTRGESEVCTEEIVIGVGGELAQHLASAVAPLVIHDLPVVLWWPDDVPFGSPVFGDLVDQADRLLVDSGAFRGDGLAGLTGLSGVVAGGCVVNDMSWMRLLLWRELLAASFDHPLLTPELRTIQAVRIDLARPGSASQLSRACLFAGWLAATLGWSVERPLGRAPDGTWRATLRAGRREIGLELHPVAVDVSGPVRAPGSLVRVEAASERAGSRTRVRVTRQADHLLATADWNGAQVIRRAAPLEPFDETPFLAEALDRTGRDRVFERALAGAVRLAGLGAGRGAGRAEGQGAGPSRAGAVAEDRP
jgi:glucose-6-phosphate dehydrogenase assembly protein OpcA